MVLVANNKNIKKQGLTRKKWLFITTFLGVSLLIIPIIMFFVDPVLVTVQYKLRLENGSMLHELLLRRITSTKMYMYLYNVTNAERFMSGDDLKIKIQEIGPFVYQEYRIIEDLEINKDPGIMRYTPKLEKVFVSEESIGDPKKINITVPNIALLAATGLISKYPYLVRQLFNVVVASNKLKSFMELPAHNYIWGYKHPLIQLANSVVPGLIYFKSVGLFERMYDVDVDYRLEVGTEEENKFSVKKVTKIQAKNRTDARALLDNTFEYNNMYEGAAFPPGLTPHTPIYIYRHGLCKTFHLQYADTRRMSNGGECFVYRLHDDAFSDRKLCDTTGWCPEGLKDMSDCYFGFPMALSKGHYLDSDPRLLDMVEGLKPDREVDDTEVIVDPKISVGISGSMAMQLSLFLADVGFNAETRRLKDTVLPIANIIATAPPLIEEVKSALRLVYKQGPYITAAVQVICSLLGIILVSYSVRMMYWIWIARKYTQKKREQCSLLKS